MTIISKSYREYFTEYWWDFNAPGSRGGYSFPTDEHGNLLEDKLTDLHREALANCLDPANGYTDQGIRKVSWGYTHPAIRKCGCGEKVELAGFTNTCENCGRDYNLGGDLLAPRRFWGEETGESLADILGPGDPDGDW